MGPIHPILWSTHWVSQWLATEAGRRLGADQTVGVEMVAAGMSSTAWRIRLPQGPWIVRTPNAPSGRRPSARSDVLLGALLPAELPVARWELVEIEGIECSAGPVVPGDRIDAGPWGAGLAGSIAEVLGATHGLARDASGWGPIQNRDDKIVGISTSLVDGVADRWFLAAMWPFDGSSLGSHPLLDVAAELVERLGALEATLVHAAAGPRCLVHSDLHAQHLLVASGILTGVLDFGDAFVGSAAWDIALLRHYYGAANADRVARRLDDGAEVIEASVVLHVAVCAYKLAKQPDRSGVAERLQAALTDLDA